MAIPIQLRRGTAATWTSVNPILAQGEAGFETDTNKIKMGNGSSVWTALAYTIDGSGSVSDVAYNASTWDGVTSISPSKNAVRDKIEALDAAKQPLNTVLTNTTASFTTASESKLAGVATGATANSLDATLLTRSNHTGTQSADTLTDGTTSKAFLATERTKLASLTVGLGTTGDAYATSHESDTTAHPASSIVNTPAGNVSATTVQAAINELDSEKAPLRAPTPAGIEFKNSTLVSLLRVGLLDGVTGLSTGVASGYGTTASGDYSHAEGYSTTASGYTSHSQGINSAAVGNSSHAEGSSTTATGDYSHAEGYGTSTIGGGSHAEGSNTTANGNSSHAEGIVTTATGNASHAEGYASIAVGDYSHAGGYSSMASGSASHASGINSTATGTASYAEGYGAKALHDGSRVMVDGQSSYCESLTADSFTARYQNGYRFLGGNASFTGTLSASNLSGTNTGDQTNVSGNAGTATAALGLRTASTTVSISSATAPTAGQVLTATGGSAATWQPPSGTTYSAGTGLTLTGSTFSVTAGIYAPARSIQTTSFTAAVGGRYTLYNTGGVASIVDPTGTAAGQSYTVIMAAGTAQFNGAGTVFAASRFELIRSYNGSTWATLLPLLSDTLTVGGNSWDGSILSGPQSFSSTTRPTSSGTGAPAATSLITRGDADARFLRHESARRLITTATATASGTGSTARRTISAGMFDGDLSVSSVLNSFYKVQLLAASIGSLYTIASATAVHFSKPFGFYFRISGSYPVSANTHLMFSIGADVALGVPSSGVNVGIEITSATSVRLWVCNGGAASYSSAGVIDQTAANDLFFWLDNDGSGTLKLYYASASVSSSLPAKPTTALCTLSGIPAAPAGASDVQAMIRATGTPGAFTELLLRDAVYFEY